MEDNELDMAFNQRNQHDVICDKKFCKIERHQIILLTYRLSIIVASVVPGKKLETINKWLCLAGLSVKVC